MVKLVHSRGYQMRWDNTAWQLLQYAEFIKEEGEIVTGRGIEFARKKRSAFQKGTTELGMKL